jgi:hypothetical protein
MENDECVNKSKYMNLTIAKFYRMCSLQKVELLDGEK